MRILLLIIFGVLCIPNIVFCQPQNRISIQTGLMHYFFDKSPLINFKYPSKALKPFNGVLINSVGLSLERKLDVSSSISIEYMYFYEYYWNVHPSLLINVISERNYNTFNINYEKKVSLNRNLIFNYGGGLNYRRGKEVIVVNYGFLGFYESLNEVRMVNDIGINLRTGLEFSPLKWLTLFTKIDLIGFAYMYDRKMINELQNVYGYKKYPHPFDLSWRFGIGFNFGK